MTDSLAWLQFMAGMRRSEVSALRWADGADATAADGTLVTVRRDEHAILQIPTAGASTDAVGHH